MRFFLTLHHAILSNFFNKSRCLSFSLRSRLYMYFSFTSPTLNSRKIFDIWKHIFTVHCSLWLFLFVFIQLELPECGYLYKRTEGLVKEGDTFELGFFPRISSIFHWLDVHQNQIIIDGIKYEQTYLTNEEYLLTITNISGSESGAYTVLCDSEQMTNPVHLIVLSTCSIFSIMYV